MQDNEDVMDYYFAVMQAIKKIPVKVTDAQIEEWTPYTMNVWS